MEYVESKGIERDIILCLGSRSKTYKKIAEELNKSFHTVHKTINRMESNGLIEKSKEYSKDSKFWIIKLKKDMVNIKRFSLFYVWFFSISMTLFMLPLFYNIINLNFKILIFDLIFFTFVEGYMLFHSIKDDDRIIVTKKVDIV